MIAQQAHRTVVDHRIQAFTRVRTVADNVTQAVNLLNGLPMDMRKNGLKSLVITVNVADDGAFQQTIRLRKTGSDRPQAIG